MDKHRAQIAPTRAKIEAFGQKYMELEQNYRQAQQTLHQKEARCSAEQKARAALEPRLKAAESRIVELEASSLLNFDKSIQLKKKRSGTCTRRIARKICYLGVQLCWELSTK